jgi:hypothetical protein
MVKRQELVRPFNLETAVERACQCRDRRVRQGVTTRRATARKKEQRGMARRARCWQVRSAVTPQASGNEAAKVNTHAAFVKFESGQLLFLGLKAAQAVGAALAAKVLRG